MALFSVLLRCFIVNWWCHCHVGTLNHSQPTVWNDETAILSVKSQKCSVYLKRSRLPRLRFIQAEIQTQDILTEEDRLFIYALILYATCPAHCCREPIPAELGQEHYSLNWSVKGHLSTFLLTFTPPRSGTWTHASCMEVSWTAETRRSFHNLSAVCSSWHIVCLDKMFVLERLWPWTNPDEKSTFATFANTWLEWHGRLLWLHRPLDDPNVAVTEVPKHWIYFRHRLKESLRTSCFCHPSLWITVWWPESEVLRRHPSPKNFASIIALNY